MKKVIIGNVFNHQMIEHFATGHSEPLKNASARKIWLAEEGDIVATQRPVSDALKAHVRRVTGRATDLVTCLDIGEDPQALASQIRTATGGEPVEIEPYALERWVADLAAELGGSVTHFDGTPDRELVDLVYRINTKSGFREVSAGLGLPMPIGQAATGFRQLADVCRNMLRRHEKVIVKLDRSSNGYGNLVLSQSDLPDPGRRLASHFAAFREQPERFMVEEFLIFVALPSVEMTAQPEGVRFDYICDQRVEPKAGMATPPEGLRDRTLADLETAGAVFGNWLHGQGYRGVFDVDGGCLADGTMMFTEANVRRTAGSHLQDIASRLLGPGYLKDRVWLSGNVGLPRPQSLPQLESRLERAELFYDAANRNGAIFPVDHVDGERCIYQIFAASMGEALAMEQRLHKAVGA